MRLFDHGLFQVLGLHERIETGFPEIDEIGRQVGISLVEVPGHEAGNGFAVVIGGAVHGGAAEQPDEPVFMPVRGQRIIERGAGGTHTDEQGIGIIADGIAIVELAVNQIVAPHDDQKTEQLHGKQGEEEPFQAGEQQTEKALHAGILINSSRFQLLIQVNL